VGTTAIIIGIVLIISSAWASQVDFSGPTAEFLHSRLAMKTDTGTADLSIRLVEFLMGIQTDKKWGKKNDSHWTLTTTFKDPVIDANRTYLIEFEMRDNIVVLSAVVFDNRLFSYVETESFVRHIIYNFGKHVSPK
jgi:hypothetical protein